MCAQRRRLPCYDYHCRYVAILHYIMLQCIMHVGSRTECYAAQAKREKRMDELAEQDNTDPEGYWVQVLNYY